MTFVFKHPSKYKKEKMTKYVKIKDCVVGKKYRFEKHEHTVMDYEYNYSYMTGTCVTNKIYTDRPKVFNEYEHLIEIKLDFLTLSSNHFTLQLSQLRACWSAT